MLVTVGMIVTVSASTGRWWRYNETVACKDELALSLPIKDNNVILIDSVCIG